MNNTQRERLRSIIEEIDEFDNDCKEVEFTDVDRAWRLLDWIRDTCAYTLAEDEAANNPLAEEGKGEEYFDALTRREKATIR